MDADRTPDDVPRDPPTPVDLLLPGAWRSPRPDLRAARRPEAAPPLAPPPPVVRAVPPAGGSPSTLPLPLGEIDPSAAADVHPPQHAVAAAGPPAVHAGAHPVAHPVGGPPVLPPLPEWSAPAPARPAGGRMVLGAALGLLAVGGVSLWLGLLPTGGDEPAPAPGPGVTAPSPAADASAVPVSRRSSGRAASPTSRPARTTPATTRSAAAQPTRRTSAPARTSTSVRPGSVVVDPAKYVGRPVRQVQTALRKLGLQVELVSLDGRRRQAGTVMGVRPGGRVPAGSTVVVVVAR